MKSTINSGWAGLVIGASLALSGLAQAQAPAEFYKDKTVEMIVSAAPGGGADTLTRMMADIMPRYIPGRPDHVVMNRPGAGGMVEAGRMMVSGETDGTQISFLQRNNLIKSLITGTHDQFDPRKVNWIGSIKREPYILVAYETSPVQSFEDAFNKEMVVAATGFTNENRTLSAMVNEFLGTKFKIVPGYKGTGAIQKAIEGGEVHGWFRSLDGSKYGNAKRWIDEGKMKRLVVMSWERHPDFPDLPALGEFVKDESLRPIIDFFLLPLDAGRPVAVPGDLPPERLAALRKAFAETMEDPEYLARMEKQGQSTDWLSGEEVEEIVARIYATPDDVIEKAKGILLEEGS